MVKPMAAAMAFWVAERPSQVKPNPKGLAPTLFLVSVIRERVATLDLSPNDDGAVEEK